ncbi:MAG: metal-dependent transcriptional regulator [archaeon]
MEKEDYLRVMYSLLLEKKQIKSVDIASNLKISKPSVSEMLKKLSKLKLIKINPYSKVKFTSQGLKQARQIAHHHKTINKFAKHILKHNKFQSLKLAHELEHLSPLTIEKLNKFMDELHKPASKMPSYIG